MALKTLAMRGPEETAGDDSLHPLLGDGSRPELIALDRYDGANIQHLVATAVAINEVGGESVRAVQRVRKVKIDVYITDGRIALVCQKWDKGYRVNGNVISPVYLVVLIISKIRAARRTKNKIMVGQIRYPWVRAVGASRHGRNTEDKVRLRYVEKYPTMELHKTLDLTFAKGTDTTLIAQDITRRVAEFRLAHYPDMEEQEREIFARLRQDPPRPEPEPKKFAFNYMPSCYPVSPKTAYPEF